MSKKNHPVPPYDHEKYLIKQNFKCAICGKLDAEHGGFNRSDRLVVDHCHRSNIVRGLLCNKCNLGIGYFEDNPLLLISAALYLNKFQKDLTSYHPILKAFERNFSISREKK